MEVPSDNVKRLSASKTEGRVQKKRRMEAELYDFLQPGTTEVSDEAPKLPRDRGHSNWETVVQAARQVPVIRSIENTTRKSRRV